MNLSYRVALFCGAAPLLVGVSIFTLWLITRWNGLMMAGVYTLYVGVGIFVVGVVAHVRCYRLSIGTSDIPRRRLVPLTLACAGLLLLNFPVAGGIIVAAIGVETRYTVVVHNALPLPLEKVKVLGGGNDRSLGSIKPGGTARQSFWVEHDGVLKFHALGGSTEYTETISSYVTHGMGGSATITVNSDGSISVIHEDS